MADSRRSIVALTVGDDSVASSRIRVASVLRVASNAGWRTSRLIAHGHRLWPASLLSRVLVEAPDVVLLHKVAPPFVAAARASYSSVMTRFTWHSRPSGRMKRG